MKSTHGLQVHHAAGQLSESQQQVQLCVQVWDVAHLHEWEEEFDKVEEFKQTAVMR